MDGCAARSHKAKLFHNVEELVDPSDESPSEEFIYAHCGNAILQIVTTISEIFEVVAERVLHSCPKQNAWILSLPVI